MAAALDSAAAGMDLADALHVAGSEGREAFVTFDRKLARTAAAFAKTPVRLL
jgi:predicted nucleic acid-binding protein